MNNLPFPPPWDQENIINSHITSKDKQLVLKEVYSLVPVAIAPSYIKTELLSN